VVRDRDLLAELGLSFDLVVLDEAQRIKNRSSSTHQAVKALARRSGPSPARRWKTRPKTWCRSSIS